MLKRIASKATVLVMPKKIKLPLSRASFWV